MNNESNHDLTAAELQYAVDHGILDLGKVSEFITMGKRQEALKAHKYKIWQSKSDSRWYTIYNDRPGHYKNLAAKTEEALQDKLVALYIDNQSIKKKNFEDVYQEWHKKQFETNIDQNTLRRHEQYFKRYYEGYLWIKKPLSEIDSTDIEEWSDAIIAKYCLTRKEYDNLKVIVNKTFLYARKHKYMQNNPMIDINLVLAG